MPPRCIGAVLTNKMAYYHVWFATKKRKWLLQGDVEPYIKRVIGEIAKSKGIRLLDYETVVDHVHLLLEVELDEDLSSVVKLLKGISSRRVFQEFPELKMDAETNNFWQKHYGSKTVEIGALAVTKEYVRTQKERLDKFER